MRYMSIGEFTNAVNKTTQTIRNWDASGYIKPAKIGSGGHRYYTQDQVDQYLENKGNINKLNKRKIIGYCRVSTQKQIVQIITVFGARISGKRAHKAKEIINELKGSD